MVGGKGKETSQGAAWPWSEGKESQIICFGVESGAGEESDSRGAAWCKGWRVVWWGEPGV